MLSINKKLLINGPSGYTEVLHYKWEAWKVEPLAAGYTNTQAKRKMGSIKRGRMNPGRNEKQLYDRDQNLNEHHSIQAQFRL